MSVPLCHFCGLSWNASLLVTDDAH